MLQDSRRDGVIGNEQLALFVCQTKVAKWAARVQVCHVCIQCVGLCQGV